MVTNIIGRYEEQKILSEALASKKAEFISVYGRRRVGKTFLIREYCQDKVKFFFNVTGIKDGTMREQIDRFVKHIGAVFYKGAELQTTKDWFKAFDLLQETINKFSSKHDKVILFFDELPWMATPRSRLLNVLEYFWNQYWSTDNRIKLIICGSSASWIIKKIINNKGGLHNRLTRRIRLHPFCLKECKGFLLSKKINLSKTHIVDIYMVTGGIPYYLDHVKRGLSATQAIDALAFKRNAVLFKEFDNLFASLFEDADKYISLLRLIAASRQGIAQGTIMKHTAISRGGRIIERLQDLIEAGFIESFLPYGHEQRGIYYRIIDEYTMFYLNWIEPVSKALKKYDLADGYWQKQYLSPAWFSWAGYAFESICYKHIFQIRYKLNIGADALPYSWRYAPFKTGSVKTSPTKISSESGAQIDLLFDRSDDAVTVCEIKYTNKPYLLDKQTANNLVNKIDVFVKKTKCQKQIFLTLISANGVAPNMCSEELISGIVTLEDLF